jgi:hypothetical protein
VSCASITTIHAYGNPFRMEYTLVHIVEEFDQVRFDSLMKCVHGRLFHAQCGVDGVCKLVDDRAESGSGDQRRRALLVTANLP